jgi:hypothetical protein
MSRILAPCTCGIPSSLSIDPEPAASGEDDQPEMWNDSGKKAKQLTNFG